MVIRNQVPLSEQRLQGLNQCHHVAEQGQEVKEGILGENVKDPKYASKSSAFIESKYYTA
jgi:hypothetical protein